MAPAPTACLTPGLAPAQERINGRTGSSPAADGDSAIMIGAAEGSGPAGRPAGPDRGGR
jgi:hypothetical protein